MQDATRMLHARLHDPNNQKNWSVTFHTTPDRHTMAWLHYCNSPKLFGTWSPIIYEATFQPLSTGRSNCVQSAKRTQILLARVTAASRRNLVRGRGCTKSVTRVILYAYYCVLWWNKQKFCRFTAFLFRFSWISRNSSKYLWFSLISLWKSLRPGLRIVPNQWKS